MTDRDPQLAELADATLTRLIADGCHSTVMRLPMPVLRQLARRLLQPGATVQDAAVAWLDEQGCAIPKSNVYRFARTFRTTVRELGRQHVGGGDG